MNREKCIVVGCDGTEFAILWFGEKGLLYCRRCRTTQEVVSRDGYITYLEDTAINAS